MKINSIDNRRLDLTHMGEAGGVAAEVDKTLSFSRKLTDLSTSSYDKRISDLVTEITEQGKRLTERADMTELQKYREKITILLNETVSNGYIFKKDAKLGANGRSRIFATIKKVNEKLDSMTQELLTQEKENINLLDDVDDIRGLLVDMLL